MSESKKIKEVDSSDEDWATMPFDEGEDDKRWAKITFELEQLEKDVADYESTYTHKILMNEPLGEILHEFEIVEGDLF